MLKFFCKCFIALLLFFSVNAFADTYDANTNVLNVDEVILGDYVYKNIKIRLDSVTLISNDPPVPVPPVSATCSDSNFTTDIYNAITVGMTMSQVEQTIGCNYDPSGTQAIGADCVVNKWRYYQTGSYEMKYILVYFDGADQIVAPCDGIYKYRVWILIILYALINLTNK